MECSALNGENIEEIFNKLTQTILYKVESGDVALELVQNSRAIGSGNKGGSSIGLINNEEPKIYE
jgi:hypothetical protein